MPATAVLVTPEDMFTDLSPSKLLAAWPESSRSRAVAGFVRAAVEVAASGDAGTAARRDHRPEQVQHPRVSDATPVRG